jgi:hypothetical protein
MKARFTTITSDDWKRALAAARERRRQAPARIAQAIRLHAAKVAQGVARP